MSNNRHISMGTGYPQGECFTLQLIEVLEASSRPTVEQWCQVGRDAAFSSSTDTTKPSGLLLHYNYGAAVVKWWGQHTDILWSQNPPHPGPPGPRRRRRRRNLHPPSSPVARPSTGIPPYLRHPTSINDRTVSIHKRHPNDEPPPTSTHDGNIASQKHKQHSANQCVDESKAWESWDEDDWMLFCRFNTKAVHERLQAAGEESSSNIRAWAQEVSDYQTTEL